MRIGKWIFLGLLLLPLAGMAQNGAINGFCNLGGKAATVSGLNSSNYLQGDIPSCIVTVYLTGTTNKATLFTNIGGPLSNPFTANALGSLLPGKFLFYAATGTGLDVVGSGGIPPNAYPTPTTLLTDVFPSSAGGGGGGSCNGSATQIAYFSATNVCSGDSYFIDTAPGTAGVGDLEYTGNGASFTTFAGGSYNFASTGQGTAGGEASFSIALQENGSSAGAASFALSTRDEGANNGAAGIVFATQGGGGVGSADFSVNTQAGANNSGNIALVATGTGSATGSGNISFNAAGDTDPTSGVFTLNASHEMDITVSGAGGFNVDTAAAMTLNSSGPFSFAGSNASLSTGGALIVTSCTGCGGGGSAAFSSITSGTNSAAAMLVGTGASLGVAGTGTINATTLNTLPGSAFGTDNISIGTGALPNTATGNDNVALGASALAVDTTGLGNLALGFEALSANLGGGGNTAIGTGASVSNTSGSQNIAIGDLSMASSLTGSTNTVIGASALSSVTASSNDVAVGYQAGYNASPTLSAISNSTFIGTDANSSTNSLTNMIVIGYLAQGTASNQATFGNSSITSTILQGAVSAGTSVTTGAITDTGQSAASGDCAQWTTGGLLTNTGTACGSGGGGGLTALTQDVTASGTGSQPATVVGINGTLLSGLATGILKNTTSTGAPSIAAVTDVEALLLGLTGCTTNTNVLTATGSAFTCQAPATQVYPGAGIAVSTGSAWTTSLTAPTGALVGTTATQTLTNKTLTSPTLTTPALGTPASGVLTNATGLPLTTGVTGILPIANGGTATATPALVAGTDVTITGTWPAQTIALTHNSLTVGSTSIALGATATAVTGLQVNGVTLTTAGLSTNFLNAAGVYVAAGTGTVTSIATTSPLGGGTITTSGTLTCTTCVTSSSLTSGYLTRSNGGQGIVNSLIDEGVTTANVATIADTGGLHITGTGASIIGFGGPSVTLTPASGASVSCSSSNCQSARGSLTITGGTATTGTIVTATFPSTLSAVPICAVVQNGAGSTGTASFDLGHSQTTSALSITAGITVFGATINVDYVCEL